MQLKKGTKLGNLRKVVDARVASNVSRAKPGRVSSIVKTGGGKGSALKEETQCTAGRKYQS